METLQTTSAKREFISMYEDLIEKGREEGREEGMEMAINKSVKKGYDMGLSVKQLSLLNDISVDKVKEIL